MKELVEYIAKSLVDSPETVAVTESSGSGPTVIHLKVASEDMGRVIGKQGRIAQAIRTLLKVAAARNSEGSSQPVLIIDAVGDAAKGQPYPAADTEEEEAEELP